MEYNCYIVFIKNNKKIFGKYIASRPDKQTIVFEKNGVPGLHELPENEIKQATHEEICNYWGNIINDCKKSIDGDQKYIVEMEKQINNQTGTIKNRKQAIEELKIEEEKILTCLTIAGVDILRDSDDGFSQLKKDYHNIKYKIKTHNSEVFRITKKIINKRDEIERRHKFIENMKNQIESIEMERTEYLKRRTNSGF